ncbi:hypothetical protein L1049_004100 [Liquidambar formosana]|uniref:Uncharacterized protein n=1 Tax=Liquidambar formosana TaxID=63359 RepID=A0AAP0RNR5_LIQFO
MATVIRTMGMNGDCDFDLAVVRRTMGMDGDYDFGLLVARRTMGMDDQWCDGGGWENYGDGDGGDQIWCQKRDMMKDYKGRRTSMMRQQANKIIDASGTIKEQLAAIAPALEQLWKQKDERVREFFDVQSQIQKICGEIAGNWNLCEQVGTPVINEADLTLKKLDEYHAQLQELQKEKSDRLHKVLEFVSTVHDLCAVLGMDFFSTVTEVHPSLNDSTGVQSKSISNDTLSRLAKTVFGLKEDKKQRLHRLQELAAQLIDLWNLMDTPVDERRLFDYVTCNISASVDEVDEVTIPGALALDLIEQAEVDVERLDQLKATRMKEISFKKQAELEEIFVCAHIEVEPEAT